MDLRNIVRRTAALARIELQSDEALRFEREFSDILGFVEKLSAIDVGAADLPGSLAADRDALRDDVAGAYPGPERLIAAAPASRNGYVETPAVFEQRT